MVLLYSMSMKVPTIVAEAKKALEDDFCVVIGLQTTGEVHVVTKPTVSPTVRFFPH